MKQKTLYCTIALLLANAAQAQSIQPVALDAITVTGERIERNLFNTASSVAIISDEKIANNPHQQTIKETIANLPNIAQPMTVGAPIIRGQATQGPNERATAFFSGTVPRATINIDGQPLSFNDLSFGVNNLWDVERVEAFRGPQTTSQGANSIAGAIVVNSKDPTFTPEASGQLIYGSRDKKRASLAASGALIDDNLAARIALDYYDRDTFRHFINPDFNPGDASTDLQAKNARVKFLYLPSAIPELEAKLTLNHRDSTGPQAEVVSEPFSALQDDRNTEVSWKINSNAAIADLSYDFSPNVTLHNQLQASKLNVRRITNPMDNGGANIDQHDISNETRLTFSSDDKSLSGVGGLYLRRTDAEESLSTFGRQPGTILKHIFDDEKRSSGVYGELTYQVTDQLALTGGLRWQQDSFQRSGSSGLAPGMHLNYDGSFHALLPKFVANYQFNDQFNAGVMVNKGYNPGGVSFSFTQRKFIPFKPEQVWNYELFSRASLLDNRLHLNANLFYSDYKDAQRFVRIPLPNPGNSGLNADTFTVNAERATAWGSELAADYAVNERLNLNANLGVLKTKINRFSNTVADYQGKSFELAPSYTFGLGAQWKINDQWQLSGNLKRTGSYYSDDLNTEGYKIAPYTVVNAKLDWQPHDNIKVFTYVNNLFNDQSPTAIFAPGRGQSLKTADIVAPREFGVGIRADF
ncbi:TonB-dependent receptor [Cardiobacteriaceae bacterium TAE3-ERU3]|nr:TonB-dependent receptor [Cardiobacteriaceae bacterium TAE3-ERU3]